MSSNTNKKKPEEQGVIKFCGVQGCCPSIDFTDPNKVVIKDDFGGSVELTIEQWKELKALFVPEAT